jgi:S-adenosylmethionine hydrolase
MTAPLIAILTDFGNHDPFVGIIKGVIATLAPNLPTVDLTHEIPPGDIRRAAVHLWQAVSYFPAGAVFLVVVDPGVGTSRRSMVLRFEAGSSSNHYWFVGPDNGLITFIARRMFEAWEITNPAYMLPGLSKTFHGRDIFAPAAAYLANGVPGPDFGPAIPNPEQLALPELKYTSPSTLAGEILHADTFGNLLTSLGRFERLENGNTRFIPWLPGLEEKIISSQGQVIRLTDGRLLSMSETFGEIPKGNCAALIGSSGLIELASNQASAADLLKLQSGEHIYLQY